MIRSLFEDAMRTSRHINDTPAEALTPDQLRECVGVEAFVDQGTSRLVADRKRSHVDAVLSEQMLQRYQGVRDPERLSIVSKKSSRWTTERAHGLAVGYSELQ